MSNITVKFIGKQYSVPQDILTYIDLLDFTDNVQKQLASTFVRKLRNEIAKDNIGLLDDEDLATEIEQQVGKYIAKLCDNGVYTRTISDYLKNNKGYQLYSEVNKIALEKMKSLLIREMDEWQAGYEQAINKADSHVTGMGFSIWSSSFVNHAIYAAMEASTLNKQGKEAEAQYQKDMNDLRSRLNSRYGGEKSNYINNTYIPNMEAALTVFAYELLDKYVADLIANGKFEGNTLDYVDISRSNDLLKNLTLSNNKQAILENAFAACPYNIAVYMQAMKYDFLDYDSFQTAKIFKQDKLLLAFLKETWGEVSYPTKFNINYHCVNVWATFTDKQPVELLHELTAQYVAGIIKGYSKIVDMLDNEQLCRKVMSECREDAILAGNAICKTKAHSCVDTIVSPTIWNQLTEKCGYIDLIDRIKEQIPESKDLVTKRDIDLLLEEKLYPMLEKARQIREKEIIKKREDDAKIKEAEAENARRIAERNKKIKKICLASAIVVIAIVIASTIITKVNNSKAYREMAGEFCVYRVIDNDGEERDEFNWWLSIGEDGSMKMTSWSYAIDDCEVDSYSGTLENKSDYKKFEDYRIEDYCADISEYEKAIYCYEFHIADEWDEFEGYIVCWQYENGKAIDVYCDDYRYSFVETGSDYSFKQWLGEIDSESLSRNVQNIIDNLDVSENDAIQKIEKLISEGNYDEAVEAIVSCKLSDEQKNTYYESLISKMKYTSFEVNGLVFYIPEDWYIKEYSDPNIKEAQYSEEDSRFWWYVKCMGKSDEIADEGDDYWKTSEEFSKTTIVGCTDAYERYDSGIDNKGEQYFVIEYFVECGEQVYQLQYLAHEDRYYEPEMQMLIGKVDFIKYAEDISETSNNIDSENTTDVSEVGNVTSDSLFEGQVAKIRGLSVYVPEEWRVYGQGSKDVGRVSTVEGDEDHYWWIEYEAPYNETIFEDLMQEKTSESGKENLSFSDYTEFEVPNCQSAYFYEMEYEGTFIVDFYVICEGHVFNLIYESNTEKDKSAAMHFIQNNVDFENFVFD